jgi:hypothetical protein
MVFYGVIISMAPIKHNVMTFVRTRDMLFTVSAWLCNNTVRTATSAFLYVFLNKADLSAVCVLQSVRLSVCLSVRPSVRPPACLSVIEPVAFGQFNSGIQQAHFVYCTKNEKILQHATWQDTAQVAHRRNKRFGQDS